MITSITYYVNRFLLLFLLTYTTEIFEPSMDGITFENWEEKLRFFAYGVCGIINEWVSKGMLEPIDFIAANMRKVTSG